MHAFLKFSGIVTLAGVFSSGTLAQLPSGPLSAAPQADAAGGVRQQLMQMQQQAQQLNRQLVEIRQATVAANPSLQAQQDEFVAMVDAAMASAGVAPAAARETIQTLQNELQGNLPEEEAIEVQRQLRQEVQSYRQAQQTALSTPELQQEQQQLNQAVLLAMQEHNERTEAIVSDLRTVQLEYQQLMQDAEEAGSQ